MMSYHKVGGKLVPEISRRYVESPSYNLEFDINEAYVKALAMQQRLMSLIEEYCPGPHEFVRYQDGRPPWCTVCFYCTGGYRVQKMSNWNIITGDAS